MPLRAGAAAEAPLTPRLSIVGIPRADADPAAPFAVSAFDFEDQARRLLTGYLVRVGADWLAPQIRVGDILLVQPGTLYASRDIVVVRTETGTELRRVEEEGGAFRLTSPDPQRFPTLQPSEATVVGIAVGLIRLGRPL